MTKQELLFDIRELIDNHTECRDILTSQELSELIFDMCSEFDSKCVYPDCNFAIKCN